MMMMMMKKDDLEKLTENLFRRIRISEYFDFLNFLKSFMWSISQ